MTRVRAGVVVNRYKPADYGLGVFSLAAQAGGVLPADCPAWAGQ
jgi:hypothetical protein